MPEQGALADVKILDFMWVIAGPTATRVLADYGATVIRVESQTRVETARTLQPFHGGEAGPENSGMYGNYNAGKLGLTLDMGKEEARDVVRDLVRWADVVAESFSPKAMRAWGLDYESLTAIKPDIVMLSTCLFGQTGPLSRIAGFGTMGAALSGFVNLAGFPDRDPIGPFGAYTDFVAPRFTVASILAALDHRDRTGEGVYIDQAQAESSLHFLSPALLDYSVNGRVAARDGNRDPDMAPHAVYPAAGDDSWVAVAARDENEWQRLCATIGRPELVDDPRFASLGDRKKNEDALNEVIAEWTSRRPAAEVEATLQAQGIPAHTVQSGSAVYADRQMQHRGHFVELEHPIHGTTVVEGSRFKLSRTPAAYRGSAPTYGRDNEHVLKEILGYDDERVTELIVAGALE
ncbi:MAG: CoA transferase [Dehalococcoidia bacterium]